jgi:predicted ABC-type ATPase
LKKYIIFAGVNGAGKSTLYNITDLRNTKRVNTDEILAAAGGDWRNPKDALQAMRKGITLINSYLADGISFCQETTLTGKRIFKILETAKQSGYFIEMYYVGLDSVEISIERVAKRVEMGGHGIPEDDLRRRFEVSQNNLKKSINICDDIFVYDNSLIFKQISTIQNGNLITRNDLGIEWFKRIFPK